MLAGGSGSLHGVRPPPEQAASSGPESTTTPHHAPPPGAVDEGLARREARSMALAAAGSVVWTADPEGHFIEPQHTWERYTGQPWSEHRGLGWMSALHAEHREALRLAWLRGREDGTPFDIESRVWHPLSRSYRRCLLRAAPVPDPDGSIREWIGTLTDVEEQRTAEQRLRLGERLEAVGRLAGGVAHETNNQMTVVLSASEFLGRRLPDDGSREDLEYIRRAAQRTAAVTQQLLAFSRRQILQPRIVQLNDLVRALEPALRGALGDSAELVLRLAPRVGMINADPDQLRQVVLNLTLNARGAMDQGGVLTIETADVVVDPSTIAAGLPEAMGPARYALLVVSDTGRGMDRETLSHAFEPFFTTKEVGEGTGLGLSAVYGVVKQSGGFVSAESEPGKGSAFRIHLPVADPLSETPATSEAPAAQTGPEVVLLAEDDELVRIMLARTLRDAGYAILEARDGLEALEAASKATVPPSLVIADVMMPRVNGQRLWSELHARWPDLPLLFVSGAVSLDSVSQGLIESGHELLQKPVEPDVLVRKVRALLADRKSKLLPSDGASLS